MPHNPELARHIAASALHRVGVPHEEIGRKLPEELGMLLTQPTQFQAHLNSSFVAWCVNSLLRGTLDQRLLLLRDRAGEWTVANLDGGPLSAFPWPAWTREHLSVDEPGAPVSRLTVDNVGIHRLLRPRVLIAALYHPEFFPLPRFPLGISDLARAARAQMLGEVQLMDMQLGATIEDIALAAETDVDILGVSATFGQHDLMIDLLDRVYDQSRPPLVIAGGSLTARNERSLLELYPRLLVARSAGERTIADLLSYWHDDLKIAQVHGLGYQGATHGDGVLSIGLRRTASVPNRAAVDFLPELDQLDETFNRHGVAQLEASRGCTSACSFCPRGHKGQWVGSLPPQFDWMLPVLDETFRRHPEVSRTLYLVDEEFIGRDDDAVPRALNLSQSMHEMSFRWETSCRVDQVVRPEQSNDWHVERAVMWRTLTMRGLRRCLFGVESGVDSILVRFNKETTGAQNALAVRSLSALGVPTRFTYITFDPLMTLAELEQTYAFQGRTDLLMRQLDRVDERTIVAGVRDERFVAEHATGRPFYSAISYMLVSMECLIGAAYTRQVQAAGLGGAIRPSMGRVDADYADWRIGVASERAQLWVDRNFALDYTLKSLEKLLDNEPRHAVREARVVLKQASYELLGQMISCIRATPLESSMAIRLSLSTNLKHLADALMADLHTRMTDTSDTVRFLLPDDAAALLDHEVERWLETSGWQLINAADACGT
jgi:hypothetical protein